MSKKQAGDLKLAGALVCCLILGTSIVSIIAFYSSILNSKQLTIDSLKYDIDYRDTQISALNSTKEELQGQIANLTSEKQALQSQISNLTEIIELSKTESWIDNEYFENVTAGTYMSWNRTIDYPGYIRFDKFVGDPTTTTGEIYVQVIWTSDNRVYFDQKKVYGVDLHFRFPVLPTSNLEVRVGYDDPQNGTAAIIVDVSYVY